MIKKILILITCIVVSPLHCQQHAYLFAHGYGGDSSQADFYTQLYKPDDFYIDQDRARVQFKSGYIHEWAAKDKDLEFWILNQPLFSFNFPDARNGFDRNLTSLGQENEILTLANEYGKIGQTDIILMGMSRGAATVLNFLATHKPDAVVAAIVESPFDSILNTLDTFCKEGLTDLWIPKVIRAYAPYLIFGEFNHRGIFPIDVVEKINKNIPILIIASLEDTYIPALNTAALYLKLLDCGHAHTYFLLLDKGQHGYFLWDDDAYLYINAVHAFYKKYDLPYNETFALPGESLLNQCRPSKETVESALKTKASYIVRPPRHN